MKSKASNPETSSQELHDILVSSSNPEDWLELAKNPNTSLDDLEELSSYCNEVVNNFIFELEYLNNPNFLLEKREWLGLWHNNAIETYPTWAVNSLCSNYYICEYRIEIDKVNSKLPSIIVYTVLNNNTLSEFDINALVTKFVCKVDLDTLSMLIATKYAHKAVYNNNCPRRFIESVYNYYKNTSIEIDYMLMNPNTPQYLLNKLYKEEYFKVIKHSILVNPNCPLELVYAINGDDAQAMRYLLANTSEPIFELAFSKAKDITKFLFQILRNPTTKLEHLLICRDSLRFLGQVGDKFLYKLLLKHPNCNTKLLCDIFNTLHRKTIGNELPYEFYLDSPHCTRDVADYLLKRIPEGIFHAKFYPEKYSNHTNKKLRIKAREMIMKESHVF